MKALFDSLGAAYTAIELDVVEGGSEIQQALTEKTNQRTVPNIFIKGQQIGGCDAVHSLHNEGKLKGML